MAMDQQNRKHRMEAIQEEVYFLCRRVGWVNYAAESNSFHRLLLLKSDTKPSATDTSFLVFNSSDLPNFVEHNSLLHAYYTSEVSFNNFISCKKIIF